MHAFLFIGQDTDAVNSAVQKKVQELKSEILEFPVSGIEEVREVTRFSRLSLQRPTVILIKNVDQLSQAGVNAFLKALEEPQINLAYILTASSIYKIVPTIISRCQIIRTNESQELDEEILKTCQKFLNSDIPTRFGQLESIKERGEAIIFLQNFIKTTHFLIHQSGSDKKHLAKVAAESEQTWVNLNQNGNIGLQLTNFAVNI